MDLTYDYITKQQTAMEDDRKDYEDTKRLCVDLCLPERMSSWEWLSATYGTTKGGKKYNNFYKRVHDGTPKYAFGVWQNGIMGHFFPKQINWFKGFWSERLYRESKSVIEWLQDTDDFLSDNINKSGTTGCDNDFYNQTRWFIGDAGCIGDGHIFIERDKQTGKLFFMAVHPKDVWVKRDIWGREIGKHYKMCFTLEQMVDEFGMGSLGENQVEAYKTDAGKRATVTIIYAIYKNKDYSPESPGTINMAYQVAYANVEGKKIIKKTGSNTMNPVSFSMRRPAGENYGLGLVYANILECLTVDDIGKTMLMASQQAVNPAMWVSSAIMNKTNLSPGKLNKVDHKSMQGLKMGDLFARIVDSGGYPFGIEQQQTWVDLVNKRFGVGIFQTLNSQDSLNEMRVFVAQQLKAEQAVLIAPQIGEISGITDNVFDRIYDLMGDDAPEPPLEILQSVKGRIDLTYIGPINQLLKQYYESNSLLTTIGYIKEVLSVAPASNIVYDGDTLMTRIIRSTNAPDDIIRSTADIQELRAIAAQVAEQERQSRLMGEQAKMIPNMGKKIDRDSVLGKIGNAA